MRLSPDVYLFYYNASIVTIRLYYLPPSVSFLELPLIYAGGLFLPELRLFITLFLCVRLFHSCLQPLLSRATVSYLALPLTSTDGLVSPELLRWAEFP